MFNNFSNINQDDLDAEVAGFGRQRANFWKFGQGKTVFKILPPHADAGGKWFRIVKRHNLFFGKENKLNRAVTCLDDSCTICDFGREVFETAKNSDDKEMLEFADKVRPRDEIYVNTFIFAASNEFKPGVVYLMKLPKKEFKQLYGWDRDQQSGWDDITGVRAWAEGRGLMGVKFVMERTGTTMNNTRYTLSPNPRREDLLTELKVMGVEPSEIEMPNLYSDESPLSESDEKYFNETLEMLKKEHHKAVTSFEGGTMVLPGVDEVFKTPPLGALPSEGHPVQLGYVVPQGTKVEVPAPFKFKS
jgi:hypothetical protein